MYHNFKLWECTQAYRVSHVPVRTPSELGPTLFRIDSRQSHGTPFRVPTGPFIFLHLQKSSHVSPKSNPVPDSRGKETYSTSDQEYQEVVVYFGGGTFKEDCCRMLSPYP